MRTIRNLCLALLFSFALLLNAFAASEVGGEMSKEDAKKPPSEALKAIQNMKFKPVSFKVPEVGKEIERVVLPNGMILYLREDHSLPVINVYGLVRTGEAYEKKEQHGVAALTGTVLREGGTKDLSPEELNKQIEFISAELSASIDDESGSLSMKVPSPQADKAFDIMAGVIRYPAFNQNEVDLAKSEIKEMLRRQNDNYRDIGERKFYELVYPDYARGWEPEWGVISKITRDDLIAWYQRFYHPNNMMFAIVGDFKKADMIDKFNKLFGDWKPSPVDFSGIQNQEYKFNPGVFYVDKDVKQSYIRMGHLGVKQNNPDRYAIEVMNGILGGGFNSYLTEKVRNDEGLAYQVYSYFNLSSRTYGTTGAYSSTKTGATVRAAKLMVDQFKRIRNEKVDNSKLKFAKDSIVNSFLFGFDNPASQTYKLMALEYNGMPNDFYKKYRDNINKVTIEDVQRVARKYLDPGKLTIVIVGDTAKYDQPLSSLGSEPRKIELKDAVK